MVEKYLEEIQKIDRKIENKRYEYQILVNLARGVSSPEFGERVQSSGDKQKMAIAVSKYLDVEKEIASLIEKKNEFIRLIEKLPPKEYDLMHKLYVQGMTINEVKADEGKCYSWATALHRRAKKNLERLLEND